MSGWEQQGEQPPAMASCCLMMIGCGLACLCAFVCVPICFAIRMQWGQKTEEEGNSILASLSRTTRLHVQCAHE